MTNLTDPINIVPGLSQYVRIALKDWFINGGIKSPAGDGVVITENHVFTHGLLGFLDCLLAPGKNSLSAKTIGDHLGNKLSFDLKVVLPGSYAAIHGIMTQLLNKPLIVLIDDMCGTSVTYQIGTENTAAYMSSHFTTGTDTSGNKCYELNIITTGCSVQLYGGHIKIFEPAYTDNGYPVFFNLAAVSDLSMQGFINAYTNAFTYSISRMYGLVQLHGSNKIQVSYRNNNGEFFNYFLNDIDTSSVFAFIAALQTYLDALIATKTLVMLGSKLLVTDSNATEQYFGIALTDKIYLDTDDGFDIITDDGNKIEA